MSDEHAENGAGKQRGRPFQPGVSGNPSGKPRGRHRATEIAEKLSKGDLDAIVGVLVKNARDGDVQSAAILLNRAWPVPKGRFLKFPMPSLRSMADIAGAIDGLIAAVSNGLLTISEANELAAVIERLGGVIEAHDFERRLAAIEVAQNPKQIEHRRS
jgi:hypothetical protein